MWPDKYNVDWRDRGWHLVYNDAKTTHARERFEDYFAKDAELESFIKYQIDELNKGEKLSKTRVPTIMPKFATGMTVSVRIYDSGDDSEIEPVKETKAKIVSISIVEKKVYYDVSFNNETYYDIEEYYISNM